MAENNTQTFMQDANGRSLAKSCQKEGTQDKEKIFKSPYFNVTLSTVMISDSCSENTYKKNYNGKMLI